MRVSTLLDVLDQEWRIVLRKTLQELSALSLRYAIYEILTLSYAPFSTYMTFSTPLDFAASSAADFTPLPAMNAVIEPPSFVPAVMAANDCDTIFPSFCSRMANVDANRTKAEYRGTVVGCDCRSRVRAVRRAEWRATENMVGEVKVRPGK
jgi:hypothetical protein